MWTRTLTVSALWLHTGCSTYIGDLELVNLLQMLSEDLDELMRRYVFHSVYVFVDQVKVLLHSMDRETKK